MSKAMKLLVEANKELDIARMISEYGTFAIEGIHQDFKLLAEGAINMDEYLHLKARSEETYGRHNQVYQKHFDKAKALLAEYEEKHGQ